MAGFVSKQFLTILSIFLFIINVDSLDGKINLRNISLFEHINDFPIFQICNRRRAIHHARPVSNAFWAIAFWTSTALTVRNTAKDLRKVV